MKDLSTQSSAIQTASEIYRGISFLMGGDRYYYWELLEQLHNDYLSGNYIYLKFLDDGYTLMNDWKHDPHIYGGYGGGIWHTGISFTEVGDYDKENKGEVCWGCGDPTHLLNQLSVFKTKMEDNKKE